MLPEINGPLNPLFAKATVADKPGGGDDAVRFLRMIRRVSSLYFTHPWLGYLELWAHRFAGVGTLYRTQKEGFAITMGQLNEIAIAHDLGLLKMDVVLQA